MVEIRYGDQHEVTDLAGHTISEAREHFKSELGIPDIARARLNGSKVKTSAELDTVLNDDDRLTFAVSRGRGAYLIGALLLALACTGGIFAYTATTDTAALVLSEKADYATVTDNSSSTIWDVFGKYKGATGSGQLFMINPASGFTGDLSASVLLANADELVNVYRVLVFKLYIYSDSGGSVNTSDTVAGPAYLTLSNGEVSMDMDLSGHTAPYHVYLDSGFYISYSVGGGWSGAEDPDLLCDVYQKGT